jgi:hypothetical protein
MDPIQELVNIWRSERPPLPCEIPACRARLYTAAVHEICQHAEQHHNYDPETDYRFRWAKQHLQLADKKIKSIDEELELLFQLRTEPAPPPTKKQLAANDP